MNEAVITPQERDTLLKALAPLADHIERVSIFGSRAIGRAQPGSDIDLVIYGDIDAKAERRLWTELEDSNLPVSVDIVVYTRIDNPLLQEHIDAVSVPLFSQADLRRRS